MYNLKATAFFFRSFFLSFEEKFSVLFSVRQTDRQRRGSSQCISLLFFFSFVRSFFSRKNFLQVLFSMHFSLLFFFKQSTDFYSHARSSVRSVRSKTPRAFCVRKGEIKRERLGCFEDDDENAFFPFSSFLSLLLSLLFDDDGFDDGGEEDDDGISLFSCVRAVRVSVGDDRTGRRQQKRGVLLSERCFVDPENE